MSRHFPYTTLFRSQESLYTWYSTVAREFPDLPIVAYNVPVRTAVDLAPETFARLYRDHDNIVGIKETTKDFEHFSRTMHLCGPEDRKSTRLNSSHVAISYAVFCLKK